MKIARSGFSEEGAKACIDCHETAKVMGILETAHAKASDSRTPAAQKECQSCHGPSATHMQFPMQVSNMNFGKASKTAPEMQNRMCLECHEDGDREAWHASAHGFDELVCSTCHSIHDPDRIIPERATVTSGCSTEACHGDLMGSSEPADFSHALGENLDGQGFSPFAEVIEGMDVVDSIYSKNGQEPQQGKIQEMGNKYLNATFPKLDFIKKATVVTE